MAEPWPTLVALAVTVVQAFWFAWMTWTLFSIRQDTKRAARTLDVQVIHDAHGKPTLIITKEHRRG